MAERHALAVGQHAQQVQVLAVQAQRLPAARLPPIILLADDGLGWVQVERQLDLRIQYAGGV